MSLLPIINARGVLASRPAAAAANEGYNYYGTDTGILYRSNGSSWDTNSSGFSNPMTTAGDLIVAGASGTPTRLAGSGTDGWVATYDSTATPKIKWAAGAGGGGGSTPTILLDFTETTNLSVTGMSAATWTDVKANQNFTVASATSLIEIAIRAFAIPNVAASNEIASRIVIDSAGTPINEPLGGFFYSTNVGNYFAGSGSIFLSGLTAAVHTIKLQAYSVTASNQFLCRTASTPPEFLRMQIIEHL